MQFKMSVVSSSDTTMNVWMLVGQGVTDASI